MRRSHPFGQDIYAASERWPPADEVSKSHHTARHIYRFQRCPGWTDAHEKARIRGPFSLRVKDYLNNPPMALIASAALLTFCWRCGLVSTCAWAL